MKKLITNAGACLVLVVGAVTGTGVANAGPIGDLTQFGQLQPYCANFVITEVASKWNVSATPDNAFNPYTWKCRWLPMIPGRSLDMNAVCSHYYGRGAYAKATNPSWAWSWKCFR